MAPITLNDVAARAGVSKKTVSRVLNNEPAVADDTLDRVRQAMADLNYVPNIFARRLSSGKAMTIGVIVGWPIFSHYISKMIESAFKESHRRGYSFSLFSMDDVGADHIVEAYRGGQVDGFILDTPSSMDRNLQKSLNTLHVPYVVINPNGRANHLRASHVEIDDEEATREITHYLIELGHRDFGYVSANAQIIQQINRLKGFRKALHEAGIPYRKDHIMAEARITVPVIGFDQGKRLLEDCPEITAIIGGNDDIAMGVIRAILQKGLRVPDDISVVGFDDNYYSAMTAPPLTTMHQPIDEMACHAVQLLLQRINDPTCKPERRLLAVELVVRESATSPRREKNLR
jgi:LacI family transcriptional regulator, galactose operon repressor